MSTQGLDANDIQQVRQLTTMMHLQEFLSTVRDKCFNKCITNPGRSLSANEQTCLQRCVDRYTEVTELVTQVIVQSGASGSLEH